MEKYQDADEFFKDQDFTSSEESSTESDNEDEAFRATPLHKRIRQERKSLGPGFLTKRKRVNQDSDSDCADESITKRKINSPPGACFSYILCLLFNVSILGCACKKGCKTKACSCKKNGPFCTALCKCNPQQCAHR